MGILPVELYREIVEHVSSKRDLSVLSITSRILQAEAESFLYRSIHCTKHADTRVICDVIAQYPRIRPLIRSLTISSQIGVRSAPYGFWSAVSQALRSLPNLTMLSISDMVDTNDAWIFRGCTFALTELHCHFALDDAYISFLQTQKELRIWSWMYSHPDPWINAIEGIPSEPHFLPHLRILSTNSRDVALRLCATRELSSVSVGGFYIPYVCDEERVEFAQELTRNANSLASLQLTFPCHKSYLLATLDALAEYLPGLQSLGHLPVFTTQASSCLFFWFCLSPNMLKR
ncbi:hypothetical protein WOLCODRAFT_74489 [Wolfiporia cocos MD-104 SS10]|uniref:F-box domain-containing protein n=1 Tax=Wolfiporia cocos (strain MD-104) TaxID=742152 RepID=A0A2H3JKQ1_WOLCO|nr:hypothetical protein WOLCODRAFT_74489 [Wolfiporia cocos MD-104 SS10]